MEQATDASSATLPVFTKTSGLCMIPPSRLDSRTDKEIISALLQFQPVTSEKNLWTFWDTGFWGMRPYVRRNIIGWVRRLGPEWTVRVLDHVEGSPLNVEAYLESNEFHDAFISRTMTGPYIGVWMDAGTMLFRDMDSICWKTLEDPNEPYEIAGFAPGTEPGNDVIMNGFIAARKGNGFVRRWHDVYLEIWKGRTDCLGLQSHPLLRQVKKVEVPKDMQIKFGIDNSLMNDYVAHVLAFKRVRMLHNPSDGFHGPAYWEQHAYVLPVQETFLAQILCGFDGQRQFDLFSLPREGVEPDARDASAEKLVQELLACASTMKLSHGLKNNKLVHLSKIWDRPEHADADIAPGTYAAYLRWGSWSGFGGQRVASSRIVRTGRIVFNTRNHPRTPAVIPTANDTYWQILRGGLLRNQAAEALCEKILTMQTTAFQLFAYQFSRDLFEDHRLIEQHEWLKALLGCTVHPAISTSKPALRIADVATGTAIWLLDLAQTLPPDAQLYGFDISAAQFPAPEARPSNVSLHEHNVTEPFPEEYQGSFDIVAVRLITAGLRGDDWGAAVRNVSSLLKPGGYLQWIEPVHSSLQVFNSKIGAPNSATREAVGYFLEAYKKTLYPGPLQLPGLCQRYELEDIALEVFPTDHFPDFEKVRSQGKAFLSGALTAMLPFIVKDGTNDVTKEHVDDVVKRSMEELNGGLFLRSEMQFIVRKKTSS
ncbi:capsule polysaccharide biosynthesis protein [Seiridium cupressi]